MKQAISKRISFYYKIALGDKSKKLKRAKNEDERQAIRRKETKRLVGHLLDKNAFLNRPAGPDEVSRPDLVFYLHLNPPIRSWRLTATNQYARLS